MESGIAAEASPIGALTTKDKERAVTPATGDQDFKAAIKIRNKEAADHVYNDQTKKKAKRPPRCLAEEKLGKDFADLPAANEVTTERFGQLGVDIVDLKEHLNDNDNPAKDESNHQIAYTLDDLKEETDPLKV